jgi:hypothetical protein
LDLQINILRGTTKALCDSTQLDSTLDLQLIFLEEQQCQNMCTCLCLKQEKRQESMLKEIIIFKDTLLESSAAICWGDGIFSFLKKRSLIILLITLLQSFRLRTLLKSVVKSIGKYTTPVKLLIK